MATQVLVSQEIDLQDFKFMPLEVARLRKSKAWLLAKKRPELGFYMMNLWAASWHERPAGSIEDDDEVLADLAMCAAAKWKAVREVVLRGWVKCDDGRLYHPIVAEKAREAWASKLEQRRRTAAATAAREARRNDKRDVQRDVERNEERNVKRYDLRDDNATFTKGQGQGQGQGTVLPKPSVVDNSTVEASKAHNAVDKNKKTNKINGANARWDESENGIEAKGKELNELARPGESYFDYKRRLWGIINAASRSQA
jgi:uncharacterized protein YdaU (DUF1376 family)